MTRELAMLAAADATTRLGLFLVFLVGVRMLPPDEAAVYLVAFSIAGLGVAAAQLGTATYGVRRIALATQQESISTLVSDAIVSVTSARMLLLLVTLGGMLSYLSLSRTSLAGSLGLVTAVYVVARVLSIDWVLRGLKAGAALAFYAGLSSIIALACAFGVLSQIRSASALFVAHLGGALIMLFGTWGWVRTRMRAALQPRFRRSTAGDALIVSAVYGLGGLLALASQAIPLLVMNSQGAVHDVLVFGGNQRVIQLALGALAVFSAAALPQLVTRTKDRGTLKLYIGYLIAASGLLLGTLVAGADLILKLVFGYVDPAFRRSLIFLAALLPLYFLRASCTDTLIADGRALGVLQACSLGFIASAAVCAFAVLYTDQGLNATAGVLALAAAEASIFLWAIRRCPLYLDALMQSLGPLVAVCISVSLAVLAALLLPSSWQSSGRLLVGLVVVATTLASSQSSWRAGFPRRAR